MDNWFGEWKGSRWSIFGFITRQPVVLRCNQTTISRIWMGGEIHNHETRPSFHLMLYTERLFDSILQRRGCWWLWDHKHMVQRQKRHHVRRSLNGYSKKALDLARTLAHQSMQKQKTRELSRRNHRQRMYSSGVQSSKDCNNESLFEFENKNGRF